MAVNSDRHSISRLYYVFAAAMVVLIFAMNISMEVEEEEDIILRSPTSELEVSTVREIELEL